MSAIQTKSWRNAYNDPGPTCEALSCSPRSRPLREEGQAWGPPPGQACSPESVPRTKCCCSGLRVHWRVLPAGSWGEGAVSSPGGRTGSPRPGPQAVVRVP